MMWLFLGCLVQEIVEIIVLQMTAFQHVLIEPKTWLLPHISRYSTLTGIRSQTKTWIWRIEPKSAIGGQSHFEFRQVLFESFSLNVQVDDYNVGLICGAVAKIRVPFTPSTRDPSV
jgi:hypothetical protein